MTKQSQLNAIACLLIVLGLTAISVSAQATATATPTPRQAVPPVPAKVIDDASVPSGWRRYQFGESPNFSVIMPAAPEATAERAPGIETAVVNLYIATNDNAVYGASRLQGLGTNMDAVSEDVRASFFKNYIEGFSRGFQGSMKQNNLNYELKMLPPTKVKATNRDAFQQDFTVGPFTGRAQLVFAGSAAFAVLTIWNQRTPTIDRELFFNSFKLTGTPK